MTNLDLINSFLFNQHSIGIIILISLCPVASMFSVIAKGWLFNLCVVWGWIDRYLAIVRWFFFPALLIVSGYSIYLLKSVSQIAYFIIILLLILAHLLHRKNKLIRKLNLIKCISECCLPNHKELLKYLNAVSGPFCIEYPKTFPEYSFDQIDFRSLKFVPIIFWIRGVGTTIRMARLVILASKKMGIHHLNSVTLPLVSAWGCSVIFYCRAAVSFKQGEILEKTNQPVVYLLTHSSFLDFAVTPILAAYRRKFDKSVTLPNFLVAANHFLYNPVYRWFLGIGQAAKAMGMIFVSRSGKKKDAKLAIEETITTITANRDVAIFPQGTRAHGRSNNLGERVEAGYYAVGSRQRMSFENGHVKKGAAYLGMELARRKKTTTFLPIAIHGASIVCPRGSSKINPGGMIEFRIGEPIYSNTMLNYDVEKWRLVIDERLRAVTGINTLVERYFLKDMRQRLDPSEFEELALALKPWRSGDNLLHSILDVVYTINPKKRGPFVGEAARLILNNADKEQFMNLKARVATMVK